MERNKQHLRIERKHPRIETGVHCLVGLPGANLSAGLIRNMSENGLNFSCGRHTIYNILPENRRTPGLVTDILVEIRFELQRPDLKALAVKCKAVLVHFERLAQDSFHVGIKFIHMDKTTQKGLRAYLQSTIDRQAI